MRKENAMAKVTRHGAAKPDDAIFKEGYTIAVQPPKQKTEAKGPKNPAGNRKSGRSSVGRCFSHFVAVYLQKACAIFPPIDDATALLWSNSEIAPEQSHLCSKSQ